MDSNQIKYLKQVLGIQSLMLPIDRVEDAHEEFRPDPQLEYANEAVKSTNHIKAQGNGHILFLGINNFSDPNIKGLFDKMLVAMELKASNIILGEVNPNFIEDFKEDIWNEVREFDCHLAVIFGEKLHQYLFDDFSKDWNGKWLNKMGITCLSTWSPEDLLTNNELKKVAWNDLKLVIKKMDQMEI